ncbi:MAG: restriction endonuclease subunit S [Candidatus Muirbacterium halophilum]|nr:restriction endonuclease subunit S [Candidatus Muirbacterium halophilum]
MNNINKKKLVPKYRFSEFENSGEWNVNSLKDLAKRKIKRNKNINLKRVLSNSAIDGIIEQNNFFKKNIANENNLENYFLVDNGDYIYNPRISKNAPVGPISKNKIGKGIMSPLYLIFRFNIEQNDFFEHFFKTNYWHKYLNYKANRGARYDRLNISNEDFFNMLLPYPEELEQQKIADCLTSLDELIELETQKLETYKLHKKGLMQKLFPEEDKTVPSLRFPEFENRMEWKNIILSDLLNYERPEKYIVNNTEYNGENVPVLTANKSFILGYTNETYGIFKDFPVIIFDDFTVDMKYVDFPFKVKSSAIKILKIKQKDNIKFLFESMKMINFDAKEHKRYYISEFQYFFLKVPEPKEQQKIADCLSSLDELINAQNEKIENLKTHKKGLIQGLFPTVEEVDE